ncbi:D-aminoacyl-tRNA deacylase 2-like isoform X2 [Hydractinia symbiolongicarpus]|uniref:D-aminoacyl-tRNA deacylase 2-like isoform X2 n=1 Tax=Hydractinia symbiolongicarpus TaxID=13093 RepID=UPI00254D6E5E|nr:D-aminoacyl-tRNA deacylase 2-like isoform X2 [Hydractinia symbiolongicarpus]
MTTIVARSVLQQCMSAKLMVQPKNEQSDAEYVQITRGVVIFICFMKGASLQAIPKIVKALLEVKLSFCEERKKRFSILELPGDVLIVPQATLGGKMKGKVIQYHGNIDKDVGQELYRSFVQQVREVFEANKSVVPSECIVQSGTYGNLQVLSVETNGPYTHVIEF